MSCLSFLSYVKGRENIILTSWAKASWRDNTAWGFPVWSCGMGADSNAAHVAGYLTSGQIFLLFWASIALC